MLFYVNDAFVQEKDAKISLLDLGLLRGLAVCEYVRTYGGEPFLLWEHLRRFEQSADVLGLQLPKSLKEIAEIVRELIEKSDWPESSIKFLATGGVSEDQFHPTSQATLILFSYPFVPLPQKLYSEGVRVVLASLLRSMPQCKSTHYAAAISTLKKAKGVFELIYVDEKGVLLEGATSNLFSVKKGCLHTYGGPEVLPGVTRNCILQLVHGRFPVKTRGITLAELHEVEEMFLTASNKEILPITELCFDLKGQHLPSQKIGNGKVGPITMEVTKMFRKEVENKKRFLLL